MMQAYRPGEIATKGQKVFEERIRPLIAPTDREKYLVIEVESGDYRVDTDEEKAFAELDAIHPDGAFYFVRADGTPSAFMGAW